MVYRRRRRRVLSWSFETHRKVQHKNMLEALSKRCSWDPSWESTRQRHGVLANEIARNHHQQHGATWLYWTCAHQDLHHILFPEVPGMSSSRLFRVKGAPRNLRRDIVQKVFTALFRRSRGKLLAGRCPSFQASTMLRMMKARFKSIFECMEYPRRHLPRRGEDDRDETFGWQPARRISRQVHHQRLETRIRVLYVQRGIKGQAKRDGKHRAVRTRRSSQNNSVSYLLLKKPEKDQYIADAVCVWYPLKSTQTKLKE